MADVVIEEEDVVMLQRSSGVQGVGEHVAGGARTGLVWIQTAAQVQLAGRQQTEKSRLLVPVSVSAHGSDVGHAAAAAAAAALQVLDAANFVVAQGRDCQMALLEQDLEQEVERLCFAQLPHDLPQHWNHAVDQAQALLLDSAALLQNRHRGQHWVAWPQLLRNMHA